MGVALVNFTRGEWRDAQVALTFIVFVAAFGTINLAILHFKTDEAAGVPAGKDFVGINHLGFWVDDLAAIDSKITGAGGKAFLDQDTHLVVTIDRVLVGILDSVAIITASSFSWSSILR